jgi:hypothetical protein
MKAVKTQIEAGKFSNWSLGRATAFRMVAKHYPDQAKFWRGLMRDNARDAVKDARFYLDLHNKYGVSQ